MYYTSCYWVFKEYYNLVHSSFLPSFLLEMHQGDRCSGPGAMWLLTNLVWWMGWVHLRGEPFQLCFLHPNQDGRSHQLICNNIAETEMYTATMMSSGATWNTELNIKRYWCWWRNISVLPASLVLCTHSSYDSSIFLCLALLGVFSLYLSQGQ